MRIEWSKVAIKEMRSIPLKMRALIVEKVEQFAEDPPALANNVRQLKGRAESRLRVGNYRVLYTVRDEVVTIMIIHSVRHRRDAYD